MPRDSSKLDHHQENGHRKSHHHHHNHAKKHLKATSMAARKPTGDTKKLLTKTYSEIGMNSSNGGGTTTNNNNGGNSGGTAGGGSPGTPTPSEKVSKWHRDILLVSPSGQTHPRQCICDQCMAEYGTYRIYNQLLDNPNSAVIKVSEEVQRQTEEEIVHQDVTKSDKVRKCPYMYNSK